MTPAPAPAGATPPPAPESGRLNVADLLRAAASRQGERTAIAAAAGSGFATVSFAALDRRSDAIARGLREGGFARGELALVMVRAGIDLITTTWACFKAGVVPVLIDPGMGLRAFLGCVQATAPTALIGVPLAHAVRLVAPGAFRSVRRHVTVGTRWAWGGARLADLERAGEGRGPFGEDTTAAETAAVLFTSGSTGPAKGVVYSHGMFTAQARLLRQTYGFAPGEVDLAAFPLFSLFDAALEMTSVIPDMDPSRPGSCDPGRIVDALTAHAATTAFGSPALWGRVAPFCRERGLRLPRLRRVLSAGASVPPALIEALHGVIAADGDVHTPYGATEALPVSTIGGREVTAETAARSRAGGGTCVGRVVGEMEARVICIRDQAIPRWSDDLVLPEGEVGEICVRGPVVTHRYHQRPEATALAKIADGDTVWHRMGDLGYRDPAGRLWFCGRKAERVETAAGPLFTDQVEGLCLAQPGVSRCALVGVGERGRQRPVLVVEGKETPGLGSALRERAPVEAVLFHPRFPVDVRHNAKIHRATLAAWAAGRLPR